MRPKASRRRYGFSCSLGIVLGSSLLVGLAIGFLVTNRSMQTRRQTSESLLPIPPSISQELPYSQVGFTVDWETYSDDSLNFSIKYPDDWYQEENPFFQRPKPILEVLETKVIFANSPSILPGGDAFVPGGCRFDVLVAKTEKDSEHLLRENRYMSIGALSTPASEIFIVIDGNRGISRTYLPDSRMGNNGGTVILLPRSGNLFALYYFTTESKIGKICNHIFESMLKSFRFLNR